MGFWLSDRLTQKLRCSSYSTGKKYTRGNGFGIKKPAERYRLSPVTTQKQTAVEQVAPLYVSNLAGSESFIINIALGKYSQLSTV